MPRSDESRQRRRATRETPLFRRIPELLPKRNMRVNVEK